MTQTTQNFIYFKKTENLPQYHFKYAQVREQKTQDQKRTQRWTRGHKGKLIHLQWTVWYSACQQEGQEHQGTQTTKLTTTRHHRAQKTCKTRRHSTSRHDRTRESSAAEQETFYFFVFQKFLRRWRETAVVFKDKTKNNNAISGALCSGAMLCAVLFPLAFCGAVVLPCCVELCVALPCCPVLCPVVLCCLVVLCRRALLCFFFCCL